MSLIQSSLAMGTILLTWRKTKFNFIPTAGRKPGYVPKSYRPISLTSFLLEAMEKVKDNYIRQGVLKIRPLH